MRRTKPQEKKEGKRQYAYCLFRHIYLTTRSLFPTWTRVVEVMPYQSLLF